MLYLHVIATSTCYCVNCCPVHVCINRNVANVAYKIKIRCIHELHQNELSSCQKCLKGFTFFGINLCIFDANPLI